MKMGIGIGWPNATAGVAPIITRTGWFNIAIDCNGTEYIPNVVWTQQLTNTTLQSGQYAFAPGIGLRVLLGTFSETYPEILTTITIDDSQGFNSCPT